MQAFLFDSLEFRFKFLELFCVDCEKHFNERIKMQFAAKIFIKTFADRVILPLTINIVSRIKEITRQHEKIIRYDFALIILHAAAFREIINKAVCGGSGK